MILLDTNVWSETSKLNANRQVLRWIEDKRDHLWLSPIVIAELRAGIENPAAAHKRTGLEKWLARLQLANLERTLEFDSAAAHALGMLLVAKPNEAKMLDTLLAAQGLSRDCPIATRNVKDFAWTGVAVVNPWDE